MAGRVRVYKRSMSRFINDVDSKSERNHKCRYSRSGEVAVCSLIENLTLCTEGAQASRLRYYGVQQNLARVRPSRYVSKMH